MNKIINQITLKLGEKYLWISTDETTDIKGKYVVDVMVGTLHPENPPLWFSVAAKVRLCFTTNYVTDIIFNNVKNVAGDDCLQVLLYISHSASVMLKTDKEQINAFETSYI